MLGFVVTPTTCELSMSCSSEPDWSLSRDRSSSQMETPDEERAASESDTISQLS